MGQRVSNIRVSESLNLHVFHQKLTHLVTLKYQTHKTVDCILIMDLGLLHLMNHWTRKDFVILVIVPHLSGCVSDREESIQRHLHIIKRF